MTTKAKEKAPVPRKRKPWRWLIVIIVLVLCGRILGDISSSMDSETGLTKNGQLRPCPSSPNAVCSEDPDATRRVEPFPWKNDQDWTRSAIFSLLESWPRTTLVSEKNGYFHATTSTAIFGFVDDIEFRIDKEAQVVQVRSASRVGYSDFGTNAKRIAAMRQMWNSIEK